jgi:hypothetical protein
MRDGFRLGERIWRHGSIKLARRMNTKSSRLIEHERVVRNKEKTSSRARDRVAISCVSVAVDASDALGDRGQRNFLVGVHRRAQSTEINGDRIDCLLIEGSFVNTGRPPPI